MNLYNKLLFSALLLITFTALFSASCFGQTVLYGMTDWGGSNGYGSVFNFKPSTGKDSVLWSFENAPDGAYPTGTLVYDANKGLLYGLTSWGGTDSVGAIVSIDPTNNNEKVLWSFGKGTDGKYPEGSLIYDSVDGLYYGMTADGGMYGQGTIYSFDTKTNKDSVVWNFGGVANDGLMPYASLAFNPKSGVFYATTYVGGSNYKGTIISFDPKTNQESVLWNFPNSANDGKIPQGSLVYDNSNGLFYGTTSQGGGSGNFGTIFSFNPVTNRDSVVWSFTGGPLDASDPQCDLVYDANNGLFYTLAAVGGSGTGIFNGAIISFDPTNNTESLVWSFGKGQDGVFPVGDLVYDASSGLFYGMTNQGGTYYSQGTLFSFNPVGNAETVLWNFGNGKDGANPNASLVLYNPALATGVKTVSPAAINIFPNPVNNLLNVNGLTGGQVLELYNYSGQKISSMIAENGSKQFSLSAYPNGIYLLRILNADGTLAEIRKVVKTD